MGQKVHPTGFRLAVRKNWRSLWFASKKEFSANLIEDVKIRKFLEGKSCCAGTSEVIIKRTGEKIEVTIRTARPGLVIGKKGAEIELLKKDLKKLTKKEIWIEVEEIKRPDLDATLVAQSISKQLEKRGAWRRSLKRAIQLTMDAGAEGIKIAISGRIGGAEIARTEGYKEGRVPLHTLRNDIHYGTARSQTTYGVIGVKVWINKGEKSIMNKSVSGGQNGTASK